MDSQYSNNEKGPALFDFLVEAELQHYYDYIRRILKIQKTSQLKYATDEDLSQLGMSRPEQRRLRKFYHKHYPHNYFSKIKKLLGTSRRDDANTSSHLGLTDDKTVDAGESDINTKVPNQHIIPIENITINTELGAGEFGIVQQGVWTNNGRRYQVAVKCLSRDRVNSNAMEFLKEAAIMHSIDHPCIVRLYGVVLQPEQLMLVTELAPLRSLLECLKEFSLKTNFPVITLCDFSLQICKGMAYLEAKRLIHRDLAARNILVFTKNRVKISDFGLSRALGVGEEYYRTNYNVNLKLPVAWCAPECISYLKFTSASDVWAFAVTLWEMFSYGFQPWAAFSGIQILVTIDEPNFQRLEQPDCCPTEYYNLMQKCWRHDAERRPKFCELTEMLPECKPEQVQVAQLPNETEYRKRSDMFRCRVGDIITVLDKSNHYWKGILDNGKIGYFNPTNTVTHLNSTLPSTAQPSSYFARSSNRDLSASFRRSSDRNSMTSKRRLRSDMISAPQGDVRHTSHIGLDGAHFGDVSFFESSSTYNQIPRQVVAPYKPSEDLEYTPLINPNSPSHHTGNIFPVNTYPLLSHEMTVITNPNSLSTGREHGLNPLGNDERNTGEAKSLSIKKIKVCDTSFNQNRGSKTNWADKKGIKGSSKYRVEDDTFYRDKSSANEDLEDEPPHEYQEIDSEGENPEIVETQDQTCGGHTSESPKIEKTNDFGQSLLDEMESMFRSLNGGSPQQMLPSPASLSQDHDGINNRNEQAERASRLNSATLSRKKHSSVKPISAHDQRTLDSAIALANELTARSMNDLDHGDPIRSPNSPSERSKFHFKFPLVGGYHSHSSSHADRHDQSGGKISNERRTFSQGTVPDLQSSITESSRMAYECLIEQAAPPPKSSQPSGSRSLLRNMPSAAHLLDSAQRAYNPGKLQLPSVGDVRSPQETFESGTSCLDVHDVPQKISHPMHFQKVKPRNRTSHSEERQPNYVEAIGTVRCFSSEIYGTGESQVDLFTTNKKNMENPVPLPPRDRSKPPPPMKQRHTRKYPLIIPQPNLQQNVIRFNQPAAIDYAKDMSITSDLSLKGTSNSEQIYMNQIMYLPQKEKYTEKRFYVEYENEDTFLEYSKNKLLFTSIPKIENDACYAEGTLDEARKYKDYLSQVHKDSVGVQKSTDEPDMSNIKKPCLSDPPYVIMAATENDVVVKSNDNDDFDEETAIALEKGSPDKVSVEDLLEFAGQKPCGRQRGAESDEVRIMRKVFNEKVTEECCLEVLEVTEWNVHNAIKLTKLVIASGLNVQQCQKALMVCDGQVAQANALLILQQTENNTKRENEMEPINL